MHQATIELRCTTDDTSCRIQHPLEPVSGGHWRPGQHDVIVVTSRYRPTRCDEGIHILQVFADSVSSDRSIPVALELTCNTLSAYWTAQIRRNGSEINFGFDD